MKSFVGRQYKTCEDHHGRTANSTDATIVRQMSSN